MTPGGHVGKLPGVVAGTASGSRIVTDNRPLDRAGIEAMSVTHKNTTLYATDISRDVLVLLALRLRQHKLHILALD